MDVKSIKVKHIEHKKIMKVVKEKDVERLNKQLKGIKGVAETLDSDINNGILDDEKKIARRLKKFGSNAYKKPPPEGFLRSIWRPLQEFAILNNLVNILAALILFLAASAVGRYIPSARKSKLMMNGDKFEVLRGGRRRKISISEIVVGDVVCLKIGDKVPADGLFLKGHNLQLEDGEGGDFVQAVSETNPFLFSGSQVVDGYGCQMMVTSVGMKAKWCKTMREHSRDRKSEERIATVEKRVNQLIDSIRKNLALPIALIGFVVLTIRYFTGATKGIDGNQEFSDGHITHGGFFDSSVLKFFAAAFTTIVVAIPESLRLCLPLTIYYSKKRMMAGMEMVSDLSGWETMPFVTTICADKTGTLSMNQMKVNKFWVDRYSLGNEAYFLNASNSFKKKLQEGIALNTIVRNGTPTDKAILSWAVHELDIDMEVRSGCTVLKYAVFDSQRIRSGVLMKRVADNTVHVHWKGEAEAILEMCSSYYDVSGTTNELVDTQRTEFRQIIQGMKTSYLHCIAFAHSNVVTGDAPDGQQETLKEDGLVLLALVGVKDPRGPELNEAVKDCWNAGVHVKMFTSDDIFTAIDIARQCGILDPDRDNNTAVMKGEEFRSYSQGERMEKVDNMEVMASSSPDDKLLMVKTLKKQGHIVAVCGNTTYGDALAMLEADVGISMGIQGRGNNDDVHVSSEKISDIVILDGNFATMPKVLRSSLGIYNNIQRFIQFQLTLNLATLAVFFISAVSAGEIPLNTTQVLWLNLVINTLASLALAMDQKPTDEELIRFRRTQQLKGGREKVPPLISKTMWRNILGQVLYQIAVVLILLFLAESIFGVQGIAERNSLIFNAFMLCQVFNEFNARSLGGIKSVFKGIHRDIPFLILVAITICVQIAFGELFLYNDSDYFVRLGGWEWCICFGFSGISWPIDWGVKYVPVPEEPHRDEEGRVFYIVETRAEPGNVLVERRVEPGNNR